MNVLVESSSLTNIANAIRAKTNTTDTFKPSEMGAAIDGIKTDFFLKVANKVIDEVTAADLDGVVNLPRYIFYGCENLTKVEFPPSVQVIETAAFNGCTALEKLTIPPTVHTINAQVFQNSGVKALILCGDDVKTLSSANAISYIAMRGAIFYVKPDTLSEEEVIEAYKAATNWISYEENFAPYSEYEVNNND